MRISDWSSDVCSSDLQDRASDRRDPEMHILYSGLVTDDHLSTEQQGFIRGLRGLAHLSITAEAPVACGGTRPHKSYETAQNWVTAFFYKSAEDMLGYYADDIVWEEIEFLQTTTRTAD